MCQSKSATGSTRFSTDLSPNHNLTANDERTVRKGSSLLTFYTCPPRIRGENQNRPSIPLTDTASSPPLLVQSQVRPLTPNSYTATQFSLPLHRSIHLNLRPNDANLLPRSLAYKAQGTQRLFTLRLPPQLTLQPYPPLSPCSGLPWSRHSPAFNIPRASPPLGFCSCSSYQPNPPHTQASQDPPHPL